MKFKIVLTDRTLSNWEISTVNFDLFDDHYKDRNYPWTYTSYCGYNKQYGNKMDVELALR